MDWNELVEAYLAGPAALRTAVAGMSPEQIDAAPVPGKWSTRQVICHIADFEPVYADRIKRVLVEDQPPLRGGDPDRFAAGLSYDKRDILAELDLIACVRRHMAPILQALTPAETERTGQHSEDGALSIRTLLERITNHIPHHVNFIHEKRQALS